jgi:hypothetical protein
MGIVPKIRNKPPHIDGGQWVYWEAVSPAFKFQNVKAWRYGWDGVHEIRIADMSPEMNVAGLRWFCTDMDWYCAEYHLKQYRVQQAMAHLQSTSNMARCHCCERPAQGGGLFGGMFGGL